MGLSWTTPICERDWIDQRGTWTPDPDEPDKQRLTVELPHRMLAAHVELEQCGFCGSPTIFGVYVRVDPTTIPYPRTKED